MLKFPHILCIYALAESNFKTIQMYSSKGHNKYKSESMINTNWASMEM